MNKNDNRMINRIMGRLRNASALKRLLVSAAALVVFVTTYVLILPAITKETTPICGHEAHAHSEACYQTNHDLICEIPDGEGAHTHAEECYDEEGQLICELEESEGHFHTEECYSNETVLVCGMEEHTHADICFEDDSVIKDAENEAETLGDPTADIETNAIWEATLAGVTLTGDWARDLVAIAQTQIGYTESSRNFMVVNGGKEGYSRYGAWCGNAYGDWNSMFVSFCIYYAGITEPVFQGATDTNALLASVSAKELYRQKGAYEAKAGDIAFLKNDAGEIRVAIVSAADGSRVQTIEGNLADSVASTSYSIDSVQLVGFAEMPENPALVKETEAEIVAAAENTEEDKDEAAETEAAETEAAETEEAEEEEPSEEELAALAAQMINPLGEEEEAASMDVPEDEIQTLDAGNATNMQNYITGISVSKDNNGQWQQSSEFQDGDRVRMDMSFEIPANVVTADSPSIYYTFPAGFLPAGTEMSGKVYDHGRAVGTYRIVTDTAGVSTITLTYDEEFADGNSFTGTAFFTAEVGLGAGQTEVEYDFAGTNTKITVKGKDNPYDINTSKSAVLSSDGKTIDYEIKIGTTNGTDGAVIVYDKIYKDYLGEQTPGATYQGNVTYKKYDSSGNEINGSAGTETVSGSEFEFELPELNAGEYYLVKYTANVNENAAANDGSLAINNYASGKLKDHPYTNQGAYTNTEVSGTKVSKYGSYNNITGEMEWTITINNPSGVDLGGREVVDVVETAGVTLKSTPVIKSDSATVTNGTLSEGDGKLFSYKFPEGSTAPTYYIKYYTTAPAENGAKVTNTATYKGDGSRDYTSTYEQTVYHRTFGMQKSSKNHWQDNGIDKFEWQTYMTIPDGNFPQGGYFYEDTIQDAVKDGTTTSVANTHYGTKSEIENKIHDSFRLNVIENGEVVEKNWSQATNDYVDVEIKYYTEKNGTEVTSDSQEVGYFTVNVTPKAGKTFSASNLYFNYITNGLRTGFTDGKYYYYNDGAVGDTHSNPNQYVDMGTINVNKYKMNNFTDTDGIEKIEWKSYVSLPQSAISSEGYLYEDQIYDAADSDGKTYAGTHYGTVSELRQKIQDTFEMKIGGEVKNWSALTSTYVDVEMKFYKEVDGQRIETTDDQDKVTYFTVKVTPKAGQTVQADYFQFVYTTRTNTDGINGGYFKYQNKGIVGTHESTNYHVKRIMASLEKSVYAGNAGEWNHIDGDFVDSNSKYIYSSKDGTEVNYDNGIITYRVVVKTGLRDEDDQDITIEDIIPEGMEYVEGSAKAAAIIFFNMDMEQFSTAQSGQEATVLHGYNGDYSQDYVFSDHLTANYSQENRELTIHLGEGYAHCSMYKGRFEYAGAGYIGIYYQVRITDPAWNNPTTVRKSYVNEATWEQTGKGSSLETKVVRPIEEVDKIATPEMDEDGNVNRIHYNVMINPTGDNLNPDAEVLELVDTMDAGLGTAAMELESIILYEYDPNTADHIGNPINTSRYQYHYDSATKKLTMTIPDELACVLKYTYDVSSGNASREFNISNKVSLMGKEYNSDAVTMKEQDSGATSEKSQITLYKVDKDNYGKHLAGVGFELKWMDRDDHWVVNASQDYYYTNENGRIVFDNDTQEDIFMRQNMLYRLTEKVNPNTGYVIDSTPYYLVWLDNSTTADDWYSNNIEGKTFYHGSISKDQIHFFQHEGASIYIENEYKAISVKKVWVDEDGKDLTNHPNDVTVKLYESTLRKDTVTVTVNFVNYDGSINKTLTKTIARGSGIKVNGWTQTADSAITVSPECTYDVYQYNDQWNSGSYVQLNSVQSDTIVTIKQGTALVKQYGAYDFNGEWKTTFTPSWGGTYTCPWYDDGKKITVYKDNSTETYEITVTYIEVSGAAEWNSGNANFENGSYTDESEAGYITDAGTLVDTVTLNASNNWSNVWGDDDNDYQLKADSYYYVEETAIGGQSPSETKYTVFYQNNSGIKNGEIIVTNRIPKEDTPPVKTEISIEKKWKNADNQDITGDALNDKTASFRLMQVVNDDVANATEHSTFTLPENGSWKKDFTNLNKTTYDSDGNATNYKYYFEEMNNSTAEVTYEKETFWSFLPGTGSTDAEKTLIDEGTVTVTNKIKDEYTSVEVEKVWKDSSGNAITGDDLTDKTATITVKQVATTGDNDPVTTDYATINLPYNGSWTKALEDLPKTIYNANGSCTTYQYYFVEDSVDGFKPTYKKDGIVQALLAAINPDENPENSKIDSGKVIITNKMEESTSVSVRKVWSDGNNTQNVTVQLKRNGEAYGDAVLLNSENNWYKEWDNLPAKDDDGNDYTYTIQEVAITGYTSTITKDTLYVKLPYGTKLGSGNSYVFVKKNTTDALTGTSGNSTISWSSVGDLTNATAAVNSLSQWTATTNGNAWNLGNTRYFRADNSHVYSTSSGAKALSVLALEDGYCFTDGSTYFSGVIENNKSTGVQSVEDAQLMDVYLYIGTENNELKSADTNYVLTNIKSDTPDDKPLKTSVTVNKTWFKNVNGTETEITDEKTGQITFQLYRLASASGGGSTDPVDPPAHEHSWDAGVVTTEPGEYTEGVKTYTCTGCGETRTEPISPRGHSHNWSSQVTTTATCNSTGVRTYTCSACTDTYTESIPVDPNNHTGGTYIDGDYGATETEAGYTGDTKCSGCNAILVRGETIPATGGGEKVTVSIVSQYGGEATPFSVTKGSSIQIYGTRKTKNQWYMAPMTATVGDTSLEVSSYYLADGETAQYTFTLMASSNLTVTVLSDVYSDLEWTVTEIAQTNSQMMALARSSVSSSSSNTGSTLLSSPSEPSESQTPTIPAGAELIDTYTISSDGDWTGTYILDAEEGKTYTYYVVEIGNENFTTTYTGQGTNNITISNTITERTYSLPKTGGSGTKLYTMGGLFLITGSAALMYTKRKKRRGAA